jgi:hypothetical protein
MTGLIVFMAFSLSVSSGFTISSENPILRPIREPKTGDRASRDELLIHGRIEVVVLFKFRNYRPGIRDRDPAHPR